MISESPNFHQPKSVRLKTAHLFKLIPVLSEDEVDRIPSSMRIGIFDLLCYLFSIATYISDMTLDIWVAISHYTHKRVRSVLNTYI